MTRHRMILASSSPRRRALLDMLGVEFDVHVHDVDEDIDPSLDPDLVVEQLAERKAGPVANQFVDRIVLAADTIVVLDGEILGKPESDADAVDMLRRLSGETHRVFTGIALQHESSSRRVVDHAVTEVTFSRLSDDEIAEYVAGGSPLDKAGAYGIQDDRGCLFVERIAGDYYNVVGLPLNLLYSVTRTHFSDLRIF